MTGQSKTPVLTDKAPKPLPGIYSQAIVANGMVFCSGAVPMDPVTMKLIDGDVAAHTVCCVHRASPPPQVASLGLPTASLHTHVPLSNIARFC